MLPVFHDGLKLDLKDHVDVSVTVGGVAHLRCPLTPSSDVLQIMWQKLEPEEPVTVATCLPTKHKLNPKFTDVFILSGAGLEDCDLEVLSVKEKDQGCYQCLLITPSDVIDTAKTCLWIQTVGSMKQVSGPSPVAHGSVHWAVPCSVVGVVLVAGAVCLLLFFRKHRATREKRNVETVENAMITPDPHEGGRWEHTYVEDATDPDDRKSSSLSFTAM
uniref:Immunoglobulin V-set domain-containing protein n=1 Tax=Knipowitschia caucasica TaxID=637954 RepID=A0AAV2LCV6_KNICA